jgi:peptidoglycan hydrolase-like protein with peptidoglycan-binding domain
MTQFSFQIEPFKLESELEDEVNRNSRDYIKWVQQSLNQIMGLRLAVDGILGSQTRSAIRSFQGRQGLGIDGVVGPKTEAALSAALAGRPAPTGTVSGTTTSPGKIFFGLDTYWNDDNKNPDWTRAKERGPIDFALLQSNWGISRDSVFKRDWPRLKDAGIVRGAYLFLRFPPPIAKYNEKKVLDPMTQAQTFINTIDAAGGLSESDFPPSVDVEFSGGRKATGMTAKELLDGIRAAWKVLKARYRVAPMIYTSARVWQEDLDNVGAPDLVESPLWLAKPWPYKIGSTAVINDSIFAGGRLDPVVPPPWGPKNWWIHQYQGDAQVRHKLPGFNQVDLNRFNTMQKGATGDRVKWVQRRLGIQQNGQFDDATDSVLRTFQNKKGLAANGIIDPRTFAYLCWSNP